MAAMKMARAVGPAPSTRQWQLQAPPIMFLGLPHCVSWVQQNLSISFQIMPLDRLVNDASYALFRSEERGEARSGQQIMRGERVRELLETLGRRAFDKGICTLLYVDGFFAHPVCEPVMLIEADARGERKIGTNAHEDPAPPPVIDVEVVLNDPPIAI
jgi:hypothetical protein